MVLGEDTSVLVVERMVSQESGWRGGGKQGWIQKAVCATVGIWNPSWVRWGMQESQSKPGLVDLHLHELLEL